MIHQITAYKKAALWDDVQGWFAGGREAAGQIDAKASAVHDFKGGGGATWEIYLPGTPNESKAPLAWSSFATPVTLAETTYGYQWAQDAVSRNGSLVTLPEYYRLEKNPSDQPTWVAVQGQEVPAETGLASVEFPRKLGVERMPYVTPDEAASCWKTPGPAAGPFEAKLGDGSVVTYYWYRFADQPAMLNADLTADEREAVQKRVELLHQHWTKDRQYLPPPTDGKLADLDPAVIVTPPKGLEIGYVPIATRQAAAE